MKTIITAILAFSASAAFSATDANVFICRGKNIAITMTTTSRAGAPTLTMTDVKTNRVTRLVRVNHADTMLGHQVTGIFDGLQDATLSYTLIVPHVNVNLRMNNIKGMAARTMTPGLMPEEVSNAPRIVETTDFAPVTCIASRAEF